MGISHWTFFFMSMTYVATCACGAHGSVESAVTCVMMGIVVRKVRSVLYYAVIQKSVTLHVLRESTAEILYTLLRGPSSWAAMSLSFGSNFWLSPLSKQAIDDNLPILLECTCSRA